MSCHTIFYIQFFIYNIFVEYWHNILHLFLTKCKHCKSIYVIFTYLLPKKIPRNSEHNICKNYAGSTWHLMPYFRGTWTCARVKMRDKNRRRKKKNTEKRKVDQVWVMRFRAIFVVRLSLSKCDVIALLSETNRDPENISHFRSNGYGSLRLCIELLITKDLVPVTINYFLFEASE